MPLWSFAILFFKLWLFTAVKICPIAYFLPKYVQNLAKYLINAQKLLKKMWNFAKSGHTKFVSIMMNFLLTFKAKTCPPPEFPTTYLSLGYWISWHLVSIALRPVQTSLLICCDRHIKFPTSGYRHLLLKLDTQPRSHLVVKVCIQQGIYTAPHPSNIAPYPLQALCLIWCKNRRVDGATTDWLVYF